MRIVCQIQFGLYSSKSCPAYLSMEQLLAGHLQAEHSLSSREIQPLQLGHCGEHCQKHRIERHQLALVLAQSASATAQVAVQRSRHFIQPMTPIICPPFTCKHGATILPVAGIPAGKFPVNNHELFFSCLVDTLLVGDDSGV